MKPRVLIVDDVQGNIRVMMEILGQSYETSVATNGMDALCAVAAGKPDLILLDVVMPGMDGYEVCARLKGDVSTRDIPVIFVTGKNASEDQGKGLAVGAVDFIQKPPLPHELLERIKTHLPI